MADHYGGVKPEELGKPEVMAKAILNAAEERFSGMAPEQIPRNPLGVVKAAVSHLSKREERETGQIHKDSLAAKAQSVMDKLERGVEDQLEKEVLKEMMHRKLG